jgi:hypothetical protein
MFGHQDDQKHEEEHHENVVAPDEAATETVTAGADQPAEDGAPEAAQPENNDAAGAPAADDDSAWQHPGAPIDDQGDDDEDEHQKAPEPINDIVGESAGPDFKPLGQDDGQDEPAADQTPHDLIDIKQKALTELRPLSDQLEQSPEDKFRTTMMIIQASDDQSLLKAAYDAAHDIKDDKARAQALLDIVNEINYFTQHPEQ